MRERRERLTRAGKGLERDFCESHTTLLAASIQIVRVWRGGEAGGGGRQNCQS